MKKKLLDFNASFSDVKKVNPLFSTCKVRVMYTGKNRNMSTISKDSVDRALPTLQNIPIVGEFSVENKDFKGHGGAVDLSDYKFIHTTKPYGVVPESATYQWVDVKGEDGTVHQYLEVDGCYLWTGRYEEAESVIQNGKGQSMEIEVTDGSWDTYEESYVINDFVFSALCILGDDVAPAFENANITAYSLDKDTFKKEFSLMMNELKSSLSQNKEVNDMEKLKQLLEQYSIKMEDVTAQGIVLEGLSDDEMELKFSEVFGNKGAKNKDQKTVTTDPNSDDSENEPADEKGGDQNDENDKEVGKTKKQNHSASGVGEDDELELEPVIQDKNNDDPSSLKGKVIVEDQGDKSFEEDEEEEFSKNDPTQVEPVIPAKKNKDTKTSLKAKVIEEDQGNKSFEVVIQELRNEISTLKEENESLKSFKLEVENTEKQDKAEKLFKDFQLSELDVEGINILDFSLEEIEEKCYAILGRKMAKKNFSKDNNNKGIHLPLNNSGNENNEQNNRYGNLFSK